MKNGFSSILLASTLLILPVDAADLSSPIGLWKTIDDNSGKPGGLIRIALIDGHYQGKIEKIFPEPGEDPTPKCVKCEGSRHNQPVIGMTFMWGITRSVSNRWISPAWVREISRASRGPGATSTL